MANARRWLRFVRNAAKAEGFEVTDGKTTVTVNVPSYHGVCFKVQINNADYLQAHQLERHGVGKKARWKWGRAVYSMRSDRDVAQFCAILFASITLRARRAGDD